MLTNKTNKVLNSNRTNPFIGLNFISEEMDRMKIGELFDNELSGLARCAEDLSINPHQQNLVFTMRLSIPLRKTIPQSCKTLSKLVQHQKLNIFIANK